MARIDVSLTHNPIKGSSDTGIAEQGGHPALLGFGQAKAIAGCRHLSYGTLQTRLALFPGGLGRTHPGLDLLPGGFG